MAFLETPVNFRTLSSLHCLKFFSCSFGFVLLFYVETFKKWGFFVTVLFLIVWYLSFQLLILSFMYCKIHQNHSPSI